MSQSRDEYEDEWDDSEGYDDEGDVERDEDGAGGDDSGASDSSARAKESAGNKKHDLTSKKGIAGAAASKVASKAGEKSEKFQKAAETADKTKNAAIAAKAVGAKTLAAGKGLLASMTPPWGPVIWGIVILSLVAGYVSYGVYLSTGRNDNRAVCLEEDSMNNQIGSISTDATEREIAEKVGQFLTTNSFKAFSGPLSMKQAAGLVGNMIHESAGLRPYVRQGNANDTTLLSNSEVRDWRVSTSGSLEGSNAAIGMIQWDGVRAEQLISFAEERNTQWYEFDLQMEYLAHEMNNGYELSQLSGDSNLQSSDATVDEYVTGFQDSFFRPNAALAHTERRLAAAVEFVEYFEGGEYQGSSGHTICNDASNLQVGTIAETAMQLSWPYEEIDKAKADCSFNTNGGRACGRDVAKPEYEEAKDKAHSATSMDSLAGGELFASCDRFLATVLRTTGVDEDIPWGSSGTQASHLAGSSKWSEVGSGTHNSIDWDSLKPGDVLATTGHVSIYIGPQDGQEMVAHSSIQSNYFNGGQGMVGYQGPVSSLGSLSYKVYRASE